MDQTLQLLDSSFKYILLGFNFMTLLAVYLWKRRQQKKKQHHVLFVTAHPDDEAMFFGPTITSITDDYFVHLLCLSAQNQQREKQLKQSANILQLHSYKCVKSDKLIDGPKEKWCQETILKQIKQYVQQNRIKAIFTFDKQGVSGHQHHKSIFQALQPCLLTKQIEKKKTLKETKIDKKEEQSKSQQQKKLIQDNKEQSVQKKTEKQNEPPKPAQGIKIYFLESVNILRKYSGALELIIALLKEFSWLRLNYFAAWNNMRAHKSQFVWFRKLWVLFSRYTYVNSYQMSRILLQ